MREYQEVGNRLIYAIAAGLLLFGILMAIGAARAGRSDLSSMILACVWVFDALWLLGVLVRRAQLAKQNEQSVD